MINWTNTKPKHNGEYYVKTTSGCTMQATFVNGRWILYDFNTVGKTEYVTATPLSVLCWATFEPEVGELIQRRHTRRAGSYFNCVSVNC